jgi:hypothetical protein
MTTLNRIGQWIEDNALPFTLGFILGVFITLMRFVG